MNLIIPLHQIKKEDKEGVGGKAFSLAMLSRSEIKVPEATFLL